jgi:AcrR family transcriptional regulator
MRAKAETASEFRCAEILDAARQVFAKRGFNQATVDDIAEAAGVAKGTLYLYFRSKDDIYMAALKQGVALMNEETRRRVEESVTAAAKIRAFIAARIEYCEKNREFFQIYHAEFGKILRHPADIGRDFLEMYNQQARLLESVLREAAGRGEIRCLRTESTAFSIYDMTRGLITQRLLGWSRAAVEEDVDFLFDLVWRGIAKQ